MKKQILSGALAAALVLSLIPVTACAEETAAAPDATVYLTVSNMGTLATANDGSVMVEKPVTVTDLNKDGVLTYDEALTAAHAAYNTAVGYSAPGGYVSMLWGVEAYNSLYFDNGVGLIEGVGSAQIKDGDNLYASVNADNINYADWYTSFDQTAVSAAVGDEITLTLTGFQGMMGGTPAAASGVSVGTFADGTFTAIEGAVTDENGTVTLSFDKAGTYIVSASGTVKDTVVTDWTTYTTAEADCPIMAPYCVVTVVEPAADAAVYLTVSNMGTLVTANDGSAMVEKPVTVTDLNKDGVLTYDEALTAAHAVYNTADGYSAPGGYVSKLWGVEAYNSLYFDNGVGLIVGVGSAQIKDGDNLYASVNADNVNYADWYTSFDQTAVSAAVGDQITLTLTGFQGMMGGTPAAASGVSVGTFADGTFTAIDGAVTDENGTVTLSFDKAGTYIVSASGTVKDTVVTDWTTYTTAEADCPIMAPYCVVTVAKASAVDTFKDVSENNWFAPYVETVWQSGLMAGTNGSVFDPHGVVTRAMAVQVLYSMAGYPAVNAESVPFSDVKAGEWYSDAVCWAAAQGITAGYDDGSFGVNDPVTREQLAMFLYQYAAKNGYDMTVSGDLSSFSDSNTVSGWAVNAVKWAVGSKLISGYEDHTIRPAADTERCELAVMLSAFAK